MLPNPQLLRRFQKTAQGGFGSEKSQFMFGFCSFFTCGEGSWGEKTRIKSQTNNTNGINYKSAISVKDLDGEIKVEVVGSRKEILCSQL